MRIANTSHLTASLGGLWTALGFVPFDIWIGQTSIQPPQLLGTIWLLMGVVFLWAPVRFLVIGETAGSLLRHRATTQLGHGRISRAAMRALTWVASCSVAGFALSVVILLLGYQET